MDILRCCIKWIFCFLLDVFFTSDLLAGVNARPLEVSGGYDDGNNGVSVSGTPGDPTQSLYGIESGYRTAGVTETQELTLPPWNIKEAETVNLVNPSAQTGEDEGGVTSAVAYIVCFLALALFIGGVVIAVVRSKRKKRKGKYAPANGDPDKAEEEELIGVKPIGENEAVKNIPTGKRRQGPMKGKGGNGLTDAESEETPMLLQEAPLSQSAPGQHLEMNTFHKEGQEFEGEPMSEPEVPENVPVDNSDILRPKKPGRMFAVMDDIGEDAAGERASQPREVFTESVVLDILDKVEEEEEEAARRSNNNLESMVPTMPEDSYKEAHSPGVDSLDSPIPSNLNSPQEEEARHSPEGLLPAAEAPPDSSNRDQTLLEKGKDPPLPRGPGDVVDAQPKASPPLSRGLEDLGDNRDSQYYGSLDSFQTAPEWPLGSRASLTMLDGPRPETIAEHSGQDPDADEDEPGSGPGEPTSLDASKPVPSESPPSGNNASTASSTKPADDDSETEDQEQNNIQVTAEVYSAPLSSSAKEDKTNQPKASDPEVQQDSRLSEQSVGQETGTADSEAESTKIDDATKMGAPLDRTEPSKNIDSSESANTSSQIAGNSFDLDQQVDIKDADDTVGASNNEQLREAKLNGPSPASQHTKDIPEKDKEPGEGSAITVLPQGEAPPVPEQTWKQQNLWGRRH